MSDPNPRGSITLPSDFHFGHLRPDQTKPEAPAPPHLLARSLHLSETL